MIAAFLALFGSSAGPWLAGAAALIASLGGAFLAGHRTASNAAAKTAAAKDSKALTVVAATEHSMAQAQVEAPADEAALRAQLLHHRV